MMDKHPDRQASGGWAICSKKNRKTALCPSGLSGPSPAFVFVTLTPKGRPGAPEPASNFLPSSRSSRQNSLTRRHHPGSVLS